MSLDGAKLKIVRAKEHLDAIEDAIASYINSEPYITDAKKYTQGRHPQAELSNQIHPRISAIIGDCLHNLRCSLDYVMWEIGGTYVGRPLVPPPDGRDRLYFPICHAPTEFDNRYVKQLADFKIPDPVVADLRAVQPYNTGYEALALLNVLINVDKHRLPILTLAEISGFKLIIRPSPNSGSNIPPKFDSAGSQNPDVDIQPTVAVTWEDVTMPREPAHRTMTNIFETVADVVPRFERFIL
jgi:hypothetical protein